MAIPASGSVSLSTIQSEWGGSNPISMNEYYSGSLATNSLVSSASPTVATATGSQYFPHHREAKVSQELPHIPDTIGSTVLKIAI